MMKKCLIGIGKAFLYLLIYLGCQFLVSFAISLVIALVLSLQLANGNMNVVEYMTTYTNIVNQSVYYILIVAGLLNLLIYWIITLIRKKKLYREVSIKKIKPITILPIVLGGIAMNFILSAFISIIPFTDAMVESYESKSSVIMGSGVAMWIATVIMAPIVEEIVFRGFVYQRLKSGMYKWIAAVITSIAFGVAHGTFIWAVYTFLFSMILIFLLDRSHSLLSCILFHMAFNFVAALSDVWSFWLENVPSLLIVAVCVLIAVISAVWFVMLTKEKEINAVSLNSKIE